MFHAFGCRTVALPRYTLGQQVHKSQSNRYHLDQNLNFKNTQPSDMKYSIPIIISLGGAAVLALPIPVSLSFRVRTVALRDSDSTPG